MITDITGIKLTPGNFGRDCAGNGENQNGCCCDGCGYLLCCTGGDFPKMCRDCTDTDCARSPRHN